MELLSLFSEYGAWSWLIIGFVLLALELLLPGGVFVWLGTAAIVTALIRFVVPLDWPRQIGVFGVLGLMSVVFWLRVVRGQDNGTDRPLLNRRAERHIGEELVLNEPITGGSGRVPIGDTFWRVVGPDLPAGRRVRVVGADGPVLRVEPA
ncbi:MAG: NfeD family protein [Devosia sp.]|jgi:membrane protein implicated in regulation of membrane protease activity|nr:NfeD family protein [Devosiaceae bacterium]